MHANQHEPRKIKASVFVSQGFFRICASISLPQKLLGRKSFMKISQTKQFPFCVSGHVPLLPPHCVRSFMSRAEKKDSYDTHNEVSACCESQILTGGKTGGRRPYYASRSRIGFPSRELLCFKYLVLFYALVGRRSVLLGAACFFGRVRLYFLLNQLLIQSDGT